MTAASDNQRSDDTDSSSEADENAPLEPAHDSILNIIGIGTSGEESDIARYKHEYLAEAYEVKNKS
jgi:hypothetical protein